MVHRNTLINRIREFGYTYKTRQKRTDLWRQKGTTNYINLPLCDLLDDEFVTSVLRQNGVSDEDIRSFLADHKVAPA